MSPNSSNSRPSVKYTRLTGHENDEPHPSSSENETSPEGVLKVKAANKIYGPHSKWWLYLGLALASYVYSLDGSTTSLFYLPYATSAFSDHTLISSVQVAQGIIVAVGKPFIAKIADVSSRATAYCLVLLCYVIGYIVIASAQNIGSIAGGIIIYAIGYTGLGLLTQIIIADITTLKWRGLVSGLVNAPFIINGFVGAKIASTIVSRGGDGWRWGYGMFAILVPTALAPLIITLLWAERKASKVGLADVVHLRQPTATTAPTSSKLVRVCSQFDVPGLIFLGGGVSCVLLPLTLAQTAKHGWRTPSIFVLLVVGFVLLVVFFVWEIYLASKPVIAPRFWKNRAIVGASFIGFFDFSSYWLTYLYLYSFIRVTKDWSLTHIGYFSNTQTVALTIFGIIGGSLMRTTHRYKYLLICGLTLRLVGVGLMIHSRASDGSTAELIWTQILQGIGGGFAAVTAQIGAQASVPHGDVAMTTALVMLITEIGGSVGNAIAGAIWSNTMPHQLAIHLPFLNETSRAEIFGSIVDAAERPRGDPIREGTIEAYSETMKIMLIAATCLSLVSIIASVMMPNYYLGDGQNAIDQSVRGDEGEEEVE